MCKTSRAPNHGMLGRRFRFGSAASRQPDTDAISNRTAIRCKGRTGTRPKAAVRLLQSNGGIVEVEGEEWVLHPIFDDSDQKRLKRTFNDIVRETGSATEWRGFSSDAVAIAANGLAISWCSYQLRRMTTLVMRFTFGSMKRRNSARSRQTLWNSSKLANTTMQPPIGVHGVRFD